MKGIVFLDRDGVLNRCRPTRSGVPLPPRSLKELALLPGVREACRLLKATGYRLVVVTNQPDVARGTQSRDVVEAINSKLSAALELDEVRVCWHDDEDECGCRKPKPGLLEQTAAEARIRLADCFMVGDRWRDVEAGNRAGCTTALVGEGYGEALSSTPDYRGESLLEVAEWIAARAGRERTRMGSAERRSSKQRGNEMTARELGIELFADGADKHGMLEMYDHPLVSGFTTNPTLMRKAGVVNYLPFAREIVETIPDEPISFEVFSDDFRSMEREAHVLSELGDNVYVKIPVTNTKGASSAELLRRLVRDQVKVNVTALMTVDQVRIVTERLGDTPAYVSVFAGRIADTGRDPIPVMTGALEVLAAAPSAQLIWASPREVLNVVQAASIGCHVITATNDIIKKIELLGKDLDRFSLETVRMFHHDATAAGYTLAEAAELVPVA